jgi:chromosome segregation ATPase
MSLPAEELLSVLSDLNTSMKGTAKDSIDTAKRLATLLVDLHLRIGQTMDRVEEARVNAREAALENDVLNAQLASHWEANRGMQESIAVCDELDRARAVAGYAARERDALLDEAHLARETTRRLEAELAELAARQRDIAARMKAALKQENKTATDLTRAIASKRELIAANKELIARHEVTVDGQSRTVAGLELAVAGLELAVATLETKREILQTRSDELSVDVAAMGHTCSALEAAFADELARAVIGG